MYKIFDMKNIKAYFNVRSFMDLSKKIFQLSTCGFPTKTVRKKNNAGNTDLF